MTNTLRKYGVALFLLAGVGFTSIPVYAEDEALTRLQKIQQEIQNDTILDSVRMEVEIKGYRRLGASDVECPWLAKKVIKDVDGDKILTQTFELNDRSDATFRESAMSLHRIGLRTGPLGVCYYVRSHEVDVFRSDGTKNSSYVYISSPLSSTFDEYGTLQLSDFLERIRKGTKDHNDQKLKVEDIAGDQIQIICEDPTRYFTYKINLNRLNGYKVDSWEIIQGNNYDRRYFRCVNSWNKLSNGKWYISKKEYEKKELSSSSYHSDNLLQSFNVYVGTEKITETVKALKPMKFEPDHFVVKNIWNLDKNYTPRDNFRITDWKTSTKIVLPAQQLMGMDFDELIKKAPFPP